MDQPSKLVKTPNPISKSSQTVAHPPLTSPSRKRKSLQNDTPSSPFALPPTVKWSQYAASNKPSGLAEEKTSYVDVSYTVRNLWAPAVLPNRPHPLPVPSTPDSKLFQTPKNASNSTPIFTTTMTKTPSRYDEAVAGLDNYDHTPTKKRISIRDSDSINPTPVKTTRKKSQSFTDKISHSSPPTAATHASYSPDHSPTQAPKSKRKRTASFIVPAKRRRSNSQRGMDPERKSARQEGMLKRIDEQERKRQVEEMLAETPQPRPRMTTEDLLQGSAKWSAFQRHFDKVNFLEPLDAARRELDEVFMAGKG